MRPSVLVEWDGHSVLIDTTPDFRTQALRFRVARVDAVLYTHAHADHIMGLDDLRPYNFRQKGEIPIYGDEPTITAIRRAFCYIFEEHGHETYVPRIRTNVFNGGAIRLFDLDFEPIPLTHGKGVSHGFRFGNAAYLTDHNDIPAESLEKLRGLKVLFLDALRHKPHPTHSTVERSLKWVEELRPERAFFTHICHDLPHERTESRLPDHVRLAYDGLEIEVQP
jgi:phosphoribosyl 1,2-cyclic phosphate phosphodiesterase